MKYNITKYPDGSQYVTIQDFTDHLTFRINSYEDLWTLKQIKDVLDFNNVNCRLTIPCILDAQADRRFNQNQSTGLKLVCQFINEMKWQSVNVFHPHNSEVVEALIDKSHVLDNSVFIRAVLGEIYSDNLVLMSTDAGGFKPLMKLADTLDWKHDVYSASKSRKYEDGKSTLIQQIDKEDFQGKDILIIDDLCVNGGTFIGLSKMLKEKNIGKLYLAVSHLTVGSPNPELFSSFDKVFTTDSKGLDYRVTGQGYDKIHGVVPENLQVFNLF